MIQMDRRKSVRSHGMAATTRRQRNLMDSSSIWSSPSYPNKEESVSENRPRLSVSRVSHHRSRAVDVQITAKVTSLKAEELADSVRTMTKTIAAGIKVLNDDF